MGWLRHAVGAALQPVPRDVAVLLHADAGSQRVIEIKRRIEGVVQ